jgi:hypothetical protein
VSCGRIEQAAFGVAISTPKATFALLFDAAGTCVEAPPIAHWCIGRDQHFLARYWARRRARFARLD